MRVLIAGATGLVGSHFARRLERIHDVRALSHRDLDISDREAVYSYVSDFKPALLINGAVIQVDESEENPAKAQAVNVDGPKTLAQAAASVEAAIIHFSTQYAFSGEPVGRSPYTIADDPQPVNVYGRTKVASERAVAEACPQSYIVRTSWVYGSGKNSFLCTAHNDLSCSRRVRAIDDIWSSTTYVEDLIDRVLEILPTDRYGIYHIVNEGICSYYDFALEAGRLVGLTQNQLEPLIEVVKEAQMKRVAIRPRYTPMRCLLSEKLGLSPMRDWKSALAAYVKS